jgi:hypothetical protein
MRLHPLEREIQAAIIQAFWYRYRIILDPIDAGAAGMRRGAAGPCHSGIPVGFPDLLGAIPPNGTMLSIEVKRPGQKPTKAQRDFLERRRAEGGIAFWTTSVDSAIRDDTREGGMMTSKRPPVPTTSILLRGPAQDAYLSRLIPNLPHDPDRPIEILIREQVKKRKLSLNDAYWAGPIADIARQAWHNGRQYSAEEWHEGFKALFLPDPDDPEFDPRHVANPETWVKWSINPVTDSRVCIGSTTRLTDAGMRIYILQIEAFAAGKFGVEFRPRTENIEPTGRITA